MEENLFELMVKHNLTLRCLPTKTCTLSIYNPQRDTGKGEIYEFPLKEMSEEDFCRWKQKGYFSECRYQNGFVIQKHFRKYETRDGGWLAKIDRGYGSIQHWNMNSGDFYGKTPKEAIMKAVEYIQKKDEEREERMKRAGLL